MKKTATQYLFDEVWSIDGAVKKFGVEQKIDFEDYKEKEFETQSIDIAPLVSIMNIFTR